MDEHDIYESHCSSECPKGKVSDCLYHQGGKCMMYEPWHDCDEFYHHNLSDIIRAEAEIAHLKGED